MKYSMVKQFSNAAIDNIYGLIFRLADFVKILIELFWAFFDIWAAFFLIFYNFFMYFYYIFLYAVDRGSESTGPTLKARRKSEKKSKIPSIILDRSPTPVPSMYRVKNIAGDTGNAVSAAVGNASMKTADTIQKAFTSTKSLPAGIGLKKSLLKSSMEFVADFFITVKNIITKPFIVVAEFFASKLMPVKEGEGRYSEANKNVSLIDQYIKEYEKQKKAR